MNQDNNRQINRQLVISRKCWIPISGGQLQHSDVSKFNRSLLSSADRCYAQSSNLKLWRAISVIVLCEMMDFLSQQLCNKQDNVRPTGHCCEMNLFTSGSWLYPSLSLHHTAGVHFSIVNLNIIHLFVRISEIIWNILWFQLLKCEAVLLLSALYHCTCQIKQDIWIWKWLTFILFNIL